MTAYYNEFDPYAAQWLRNLIAAGHIAPGDVDERSIANVSADDLKPYTQCHFFAGIGVWSHALRSSGWEDSRPVWTGSCPCQPFSVAGKGEGQADERHLWPVWAKLIEQCRPPVVFGEQVEAAIRHGWLDLVQGDLEGMHYSSGAVCIPAGGVGAPHIRQRLWFVAEDRLAHARDHRSQGRLSGRKNTEREDFNGSAGCDGAVVKLADTAEYGFSSSEGPDNLRRMEQFKRWPTGQNKCLKSSTERSPESWRVERPPASPTDSFWRDAGGLADSSNQGSSCAGSDAQQQSALIQLGNCGGKESTSRSIPIDHFWRDADWLFCRDGKWRPVEPGTFPLAHGAAARVGRLRAYGNAIVPQVAQEVIEAYMACRP